MAKYARVEWITTAARKTKAQALAVAAGLSLSAWLDRRVDADARGNAWLAEGNAAAERGNLTKAQKCYDKGQFWLDRANKLTGRS